MDALIEGYRRFRIGAWPKHKAVYDTLAAQGQSPRALVIACSDSRVDPQLIFDAAPGELFIVRNVANLIPPYMPDAEYHGTSAAVEFAVRALEVEQIVVMGHAQCGGVHALLNGTPANLGDFIENWMKMAAPARERVMAATEDPAERQRLCEFETVKVSLENLMTFPWIRERVEAGKLILHGCYFGVAKGKLWVLGPDGAFAPVD